MNRTHRALQSTMVVSVFGYSAQALSLLAIPLYLGTVGAGQYGLMVAVLAFTGYLGFADAGLSWGSMILIAQAQGRGGHKEIAHIVRHSAVLAAGSGLLVVLFLGGLLLAAAHDWRLPMFASDVSSDRLLAISAIQLALHLQFGIVYNLFQGLQESYWAGVYQGSARVGGLLGGMGAAWFTHSIEAVMWVQLLMTVLSGLAASLHAVRRHPWAFVSGSWTDRKQYRTQIRIGAKNFLLQIGRTVVASSPTLSISALAGPAAVPLYTVPTTLLAMAFAPLNTWSANLQSAYGEAWTAGDRAWIRQAFRQTLERGIAFGGLGVAAFVALADPFVRVWTHDRLAVDAAMAWSVAAIAVNGMLLSAGQYLLTGLDRNRRIAWAEVANGLLALLLVPLAVATFGIGATGAGVVGAAMLTSGWVLWREISTHLGRGVRPAASIVLKTIVAAALSLGIACLVRLTLDTLQGGAVLGLGAVGASLIASYLVSAWGLRLSVVGELAAFFRKLLGGQPLSRA